MPDRRQIKQASPTPVPQQSALIRAHAGGAAQVTCWGEGHAEVRRQQRWLQQRQGRREVGILAVFVLLLWLPRQLQVTLYPCFPVQGVRRLFTTIATCCCNLFDWCSC